MGAIIYSNTNETKAGGILMTDVNGGIWMTHSIPGFPDLKKSMAFLPESELGIGQLIACVSTGLEEQQTIYNAIKVIKPKMIRKYLAEIFYRDTVKDNSTKIRTVTLPNLAHNAVILSRPPGNANCLYKKFAKDNSIILDVYGRSQSKYLTTTCSKHYGLRNIESMSIKNAHEVHYVNEKFDRSTWAVSTASHWQARGSGGTTYWTCTSNINKHDDIGKGGILFCIYDYGIWLSFDKLKVSEPECFSRGSQLL